MTERASAKAGTRRCTRCKAVLPASQFYMDSKQCRPCRNATVGRRKKRATARTARIKRTYGLTPEEYADLLAAQGGACAICKGVRSYNLAVDHDHGTGQIRGLLCKSCNNRVLTSVRDNPVTLRRAALYLEEPPAVAVIGVRIIPTDHLDEQQKRKVLRPKALAPSEDYEEQELPWQ